MQVETNEAKMTGTLKIQMLFGNPVWFAGFDAKGKPQFHNPKALFRDRLVPVQMTSNEAKTLAKKLKLDKQGGLAFWVWHETTGG